MKLIEMMQSGDFNGARDAIKAGLCEASTYKTSMKADTDKKQTPGKAAINPTTGKEIPHSIALSEDDVAYLSKGAVRIRVVDGLDNSVSIIELSMDEFSLLKKLK